MYFFLKAQSCWHGLYYHAQKKIAERDAQMLQALAEKDAQMDALLDAKDARFEAFHTADAGERVIPSTVFAVLCIEKCAS